MKFKKTNIFINLELNLYYTCEKQLNHEMNDGKKYAKKPIGYLKASLNDISQNVLHNDSKSFLYNNTFVERQLLLNNMPQCTNFNDINRNINNIEKGNYNSSNSTNCINDSNYFYNILALNNDYEQATSSTIRTNRSTRSINLISNHNINNNNNKNFENTKDSPTNFTTTTTVDSGTTTSSSTYYATPNHNEIISKNNECCKVFNTNSIRKNPVRFENVSKPNNRSKRSHHKSALKLMNSASLSAHSSPSLAVSMDVLSKKKSQLMRNNLRNSSLSPAPVTKSTPNLLNNLLNRFLPSDICFETVGSSGAKLSLECGITVLIPEDALPQNHVELMYLAVCRHESVQPKLNGIYSKIKLFFFFKAHLCIILKKKLPHYRL